MPISTKLTHKREKLDRLTDESFKALHHVFLGAFDRLSSNHFNPQEV